MARIGVAATAAFGADVLERLADRHDVAFLLSRPDRPAGRGRKTTPPPAKVVAERLGIRVLQPGRPAEADLDAEAIVLVAYGALIPRELLARHHWLNVHPSLLPRWRGAAPVERAIMAGDEETGVTVIRLAEELDAGPIGAQAAFAIRPDDDAGAVYARAAELAPDLLEAATSFTPQQGEATYAEKIGPADRELDWSRPAKELHDRIRALSPHIGARGEVEGRRVIVWSSRLDGDRLELLEVQPAGGKRMSYDAWLRGLRS
ncbi:MAG TPA: methionyl-tRNA formyltransferase [Gaiellaceae bacterium]|nr:methionyl-tRNA formyltransferase [Gaiellaceae bacterium]